MSELPPQNENMQRKVSEVAPTNFSRATTIRERQQIVEIVEEPLQAACQILYDKNIQTLDSTANMKDLSEGASRAGIAIDYNTLSRENRQIAESMGLTPQAYDDSQAIEISIPMNVDSTIQEVSSAAENIANQFLEQSPSWIPAYTIDDLRKAYGYQSSEDATPEDFTAEGYFYDSGNKTFYVSQEHFQKKKNWAEVHPEVES